MLLASTNLTFWIYCTRIQVEGMKILHIPIPIWNIIYNLIKSYEKAIPIAVEIAFYFVKTMLPSYLRLWLSRYVSTAKITNTKVKTSIVFIAHTPFLFPERQSDYLHTFLPDFLIITYFVDYDNNLKSSWFFLIYLKNMQKDNNLIK